MTWLQRLLWTAIYGAASVVLWILGDYFMRTVGPVLSRPGHTRGLMAGTPGTFYLASIICAGLALSAIVGKLPHIPEDEPL